MNSPRIRRIAAALLLTATASLAQEPNEKAAKYLSVLEKRPSPGYLFDRFHNAWLDTDTLENLEKYLRGRVDKEASTSNRLLLAFHFAKQGENVKALEQFRQALAKDPASAETWYQKAIVEARTLDFDTAIADLGKAAESKPDDEARIKIMRLKGQLLARAGKTDEAMKAWGELLAAKPDDLDLQEDLMELQINEGLYDQAAVMAEKLVEKTKDEYQKALRMLRLGDVHQRANKRDKALEIYSSCFAKAGAGDWLEKETYGQIEQVFRRDDDVKGLKEFVGKLLEKYPKRIELMKIQANLLAESGEKDAAIRAYAAILPLTPGDRATREGYVELLTKMEKPDLALEQMGELAKLHPDDAELRVKLAELRHGKGDKDGARQAVEEYLAKSDKSEYAHTRAARLFERHGNLEAAEATFQKLLATFPESESAKESHAVFLHERKKRDEALAIWRKLAEGGTRERVVQLARTLAARNENEAAFQMLSARFEDFKREGVYLRELCQLALPLKKHAEALPWARQLIRLADNALDLEAALTLGTKIAEVAEKEDDWISELQKAANRSTQDTCLLAELLERRGDGKAATEALKTVQGENSELALMQQIRISRQRDDYLSAAEAAKKILELPDGRKSAHAQMVVELYGRAGKLDEALKWLPEWKKLSPGSVQPWLTQVALLREHSKPKEAMEALRQALPQFEDSEELRSALASLYFSEGKLADAERMYWELFEETKDPGDKLRWVASLASAAETQGKSRELIEQFEERHRSNRTAVLPLLALAEVHRVSNNYEERRKALLEAARVKPDDLELLLAVASAEEQQGDYARALTTLKKAEAVDKSGRVKQRVMSVLMANGEEEQALRLLLDSADGQPLDETAAESVAQSILGLRDWPRAISFLTPYVERYPENYRLRYLLAVSQEEDTKPKEAAARLMEVMRTTKELTPKKQAGGQAINPYASSRGYYSHYFKDLAPPEVLRLFDAQNYQYDAYRYRQEMRRGYSRFGGLGFGISLPPNLETIKDYSLVHLSGIAKVMEEKEQTELLAELRGVGVSVPVNFLQIDLNNLNPQTLIASAEEHPEDETLLAMTIMMGWNYGQPAPPELCKKAATTFAESRPQLALLATMQLARSSTDEAEKKKAREDALAGMDKIEKPAQALIWMVGQLLGANQGDDGAASAELSDEERKDAVNKLMGWSKKLAEKSGNPSSDQDMTYQAARMLAPAKDLGAFVAFLDQAVVDYAARPNSQQAQRTYYGVSQNRGPQLLQPLPFPYTSLPGFPPLVLQLFRQDYGPINLEPEALAKALDGVKSPILKIILADRAGKDDLAKETAQSLVAEKEPTLAAFLAASAYLGKVGDHKTAIGLLRKAQFLPMTKDQRQVIDGALVTWSLETLTGKKGEETPELLAGREAALRLRRGTLQANQRQELIGAMDQLGLADEAKKMEAQLAATQTTPSPNMSGGSVYVQPQSRSQLDKLLNDGKRDQAMKLVVADFRAFAVAAMTVQGISNRYEVDQLQRKVTAAGLQEEIIKAMTPGESPTAKALGEYAFILETFGETEKALAAYREVLKIKPKEDGARLRMIPLVAQEKPEEALALVKEIDPKLLPMIGQQLPQILFNDSSGEFEPRMKFLEVINRFVSEAPLDGKADYGWFNNLVESLANQSYAEDTSFGQLYVKNLPNWGSHDGTYKARQKKMRERRRQVHDAMCQTMLKIPSLTREGFRRLAGLRLDEGAKPEELAPLAKQALAGYEPPRLSQMMMGRTYYSSEGGQTIPLPWPEEFLVRHAFETKNRAMIDQEVIPTLEKSKRKDLAKNIQAYAELFFCEPGQFLDVARRHVQRQGSSRNQGQPQSLASDELNHIVDAWKTRKLEADIAEVMLKEIERLAKSNQYYGASSGPYMPDYLKELFARSGKPAAVAFLEAMSVKFLGPKEKRADFVKKNFTPNSISSGTPNATIHAYLQILYSISADPDLFYLVMSYFQDNLREMLLGSRNSGRGPQPGNHPLMRTDIYASDEKRTQELLKASPFLGGLEDFRCFPYQEDNSSMIGAIAGGLRYVQDEDKRKAYQKFLQEQPAAFGRDLLLAYLDDKPSLKVVELIGANLEALKKLPESRKADLAALQWFATTQPQRAALHEESDLSAKGKEAVAWLKEINHQDVSSDVDRFLAAKNLRDLYADEWYRVQQEFPKLIRSLIPDQRDKAQEVIDHAAKLFKQSASVGVGFHSTNGSTFMGHVLAGQYYGGPTSNGTEYLDFVLGLVAAKRDPLVEFTPSLEQLFSPATEGNAETQLGALDKALRERIQPGHLPLMFGAVAAKILPNGSFTNKVLAERIVALDKASQEGERPDVAKFLAVTFRFCLAERIRPSERPPLPEQAQNILYSQNGSSSGEGGGYVSDVPLFRDEKDTTPAPDLTEARKTALSWLANPEWSVTGRLALATAMFRHTRAATNDELLDASLKILLEAWSAKAPATLSDAAFFMAAANAGELTDSRKQALTEALTHWKRIAFAPIPNRYGGGFYPPPGTTIALETAMRLDEMDLVNRLTSQAQNMDFGWIHMMLKHGKVDRAVALFSKKALDYDWRSNQYGGPPTAKFTEPVAKAFPAFVEGMKDAEMKLLAEALLASLPDPEDSEAAKNGGREKRLADLAKRVNATEIKNKRLEQAVLSLLAEEETVADSLAKRIADSLPVAALFGSHEGGASYVQRQKLLEARVRLATLEGPEAVRALYQAAGKVKARNTYERYEVAQQLFNAHWTTIATNLSRIPKEKLAEHAALARETVDSRALERGGVYLFHRLWALHVMTGNSDAFRQWREKLDERYRKKNEGDSDPLGPTLFSLAAALKKNGKPDTKLTWPVVLALLSDTDFVTYNNEKRVNESGWFWNFHTLIEGQKLASEEQILQDGPALARKMPREGWAFMDLADIQAKAGKNEDALASWDAALALVGENTGRYTSAVVGKAKHLAKMEKKDEAKKLLEGVNREKVKLDYEDEDFAKLVKEVGLPEFPVKKESKEEPKAEAAPGGFEFRIE